MKLNRLFALWLVLFSIGAAIPSHSQPPVSIQIGAREIAPGSLSPQEKKELETKAVALLEGLVREAMAMRLPENRIQVLCFAADMLWKRDEPRARGFLQDAIAQFMAMEAVAPAPGALSSPRQAQNWQARAALRTQLIQTLAQHDARMALDFLRDSRPQTSTGAMDGRPDSPYPQPDPEKQFEMQLAIQIAESDPHGALQLAQDTLKQDADHQVVEIWRRLQRKDAKLAAKLAADIVAKFKNSDIMKSYSAANVIGELLFECRERIREQKSPKKDSANSAQNAPAVSLQELEQIFRDLLDVVVSAALKITPANLMDIGEQGQARNLLAQAQSVLPDIEKYLPARAAALRAKLGQFDKAFYHPPTPVLSEEEMEKKSATELIALAEKSKGESRELLYSQALAKAMEESDTGLARRISSQYLKGNNEFLDNEIERIEREKALKEGKIEEARKSLDRLPSDADRAQAMIRMADAAKDPKTQRQLLDEARSVLGERFETRSQVDAQMALAASFLPFDPDLSFNLLDTSIEKLNSVMAASIMLMKFTQEMQGDDDEMRLGQGGSMAYWFAGGFDDKIFAFACKDFTRTQAAIGRWQQYPTRLQMNMALVARILGDESGEVRERYVFGERIR
jgi:hypothetical protein